jgi:hypothetical protein
MRQRPRLGQQFSGPPYRPASDTPLLAMAMSGRPIIDDPRASAMRVIPT